MSYLEITFNPNLFIDIKNMLDLDMSPGEISNILNNLRKEKPTAYEKIVAIIDRIEFINHLGLVRENVRNNKYILCGQEVTGINKDIDALRIYLAITCIDICSKMTPFNPFDKWILDNCNDYNCDESLHEYLSTKKELYLEQEGISSSFHKAFLNSPEKLRDSFCKNITILNNSSPSNDFNEIINFFKKIRNKYTHEGLRVYYPNYKVPSYSLAVGIQFSDDIATLTTADFDFSHAEITNRSEQYMNVCGNFNLIESLQMVTIEKLKREFFTTTTL